MSEVNSCWPQPHSESPLELVKSASPWGSVNIQKPKKTTSTASTPLFMVSVRPVELGKWAQVPVYCYQSYQWVSTRRAAAVPKVHVGSHQREVFSQRIRPASSSCASSDGVLDADERW